MIGTLKLSARSQQVLFALVPAVLTGWILAYVNRRGIIGVDFRNDFWVAGSRVLHGGNPYLWPRPVVASGVSFPYPPLTALLFAPFALLAPGSASVLFTAVCI